VTNRHACADLAHARTLLARPGAVSVAERALLRWRSEAMRLELRADEEVRAQRASAAEAAWVLLFIDGLILGCTALYWIFWGHFFDRGFYAATSNGSWAHIVTFLPEMDRIAGTAVRSAGFSAALAAIFVMAVAGTAYRQCERWAWYVMWTVPLFAAVDVGLLAGQRALTPVSATWDAALFVVALVALVVPYRSFFPNGVT
jgi:hypothetical protein